MDYLSFTVLKILEKNQTSMTDFLEYVICKKSKVKRNYIHCYLKYDEIVGSKISHLTSPCYGIHLLTSESVNMKWKVTVFPVFMINFTLHDVYLPLRPSCKNSMLAIYNGLQQDDFKKIQSFCGEVTKLSLYTKDNTALMTLYVKRKNYDHSIKILVSYQVHVKGLA